MALSPFELIKQGAANILNKGKEAITPKSNEKLGISDSSKLGIARNTVFEVPKTVAKGVAATAKFLDPRKPVETRAPFSAEQSTLPYGGGLVKIGTEIPARLMEIVPKVVTQAIANFSRDGLRMSDSNASRLGLTTEDGKVRTSGQRYMEATKEWQNDPSLKNLPKAVLDSLTSAGADMLDALMAGNVAETLSKLTLSSIKTPPKELQQAWVGLGRPKTTDEAQKVARKLLVELSNRTGSFSQGGGDVARNIIAYNKALQKFGIPQMPSKVAQGARNVAESLTTDVRKLMDVGKEQFAYVSPAGYLPGYREVPGQAPALGLSTRAIEKVGQNLPPAMQQKAIELGIKQDAITDSIFYTVTKGKNLAIFDREGRIKDLADIKGEKQIKALEDILAETGYKDDPGKFVEDFGNWNERKKAIDAEIKLFNKEARKFKTAETLYHRTDKSFEKFDLSINPDEAGIWFSKSKEAIADSKGEFPILMERVATKKLRLISEDELSRIENTPEYLNSDKSVSGFLESKGYDGIDYGDDSVQLFNPNRDTVSKSQLTDIWEKANKPLKSSLEQEAKKYKSAEEFVKAQTKQEYRSAHQLSLSDSITADKIDIPTLKEAIRTRNGYLNKYNLSDLKKLEKLQNNPDADITIYRASPKNEINEGDWVTTDKIYANDIKKQNGGKVYSYTVKVKDLRFPKDTETLPSLSMASTFSYSPKASQLEEIWKQSQKADTPSSQPVVTQEKSPVVTPEKTSEVASLEQTGLEQLSDKVDMLDDVVLDERPRLLDNKTRKEFSNVFKSARDIKMPVGHYNLRRLLGEIDGKSIAESRAIGPGLKAWERINKRLVQLEEAETSMVSRANEVLKNNGLSSMSNKDMDILTSVVEKGTDLTKVDPKYIKAAEQIRPLYDQMLKEINESRTSRGLEPIPYRKNYITHIKEITRLDPEITQKGSTVFGFGKRRTESNMVNRETNFAKLFELYSKKYAREVYMSPSIDEMTEILNLLKARKQLPKAQAALEKIINTSFKRDTANIDLLTGFTRGTKRRAVVSKITEMRNRYALTANPAWSTSIQPLSLTLVAPQVGGAIRGTNNLIGGYLDWLENPEIQDRVRNLTAFKLKTEFSKIGTTGAGDVVDVKSKLTRGRFDNFNEFISSYSNWMESELSGISGAAALRYADQLGLSRADADIFASYIIESTQSAYNKEAAALIQQNVVFKGVAPFKTGIFEINSYINSVMRNAGGLPIGKNYRDKLGSLGIFIIMTLAGFEWVKKLTGRELSWIQSTMPVAGDFVKTTKDYLTGKITGNETISTSQSPVAIQNEVQSIIRALNNAVKSGNIDQLRRELVKWGTAYIGLGGGKLVNSFVDTILAKWVRDGWHLSGSGNPAFKIENKDLEKSFIAGIYSTKPGQEYIKSGFQPKPKIKTKKQIAQEIIDKLESGELGSVAVAKEYMKDELKKIDKQLKDQRFEMGPKEYATEIYKLIESGKMTQDDAQKELKSYLNKDNVSEKRTKEYVADRDASFLKWKVVRDWSKAVVIDPGNAWKALGPDAKLGIVEGNLVEMQRFDLIDYDKPGGSDEYKKKAMAQLGIPWSESSKYKLEHIVPVKSGGDSTANNLMIVTNAEHYSYTPFDNAANKRVSAGEIKRKQVAKIAIKLKMDKSITTEQAIQELQNL